MKVALLGYGVVGRGAYEMLEKARDLEPSKVLVRPGKADEAFKVDDINAIVNDPEIQAVAEMLGGTEPAFSYACAVIKSGKHFVTSNKALVAAHGPELARLAEENRVAFLFSAACGGAVPFLHNLSLAVESDRIESLGGILNGTTNYMLDAMQRRGLDYTQALADAQALGYAEADPSADVSGLDALRKIMLACAVAYDVLPCDGLLNEGIESFTKADVTALQENKLCCRLLAKGGLNDDGSVYAYVEPCLFPLSAAECSVLDNFNLAKYKADAAGQMIFIGQGAGRYPTASAVMRDLSCIVQGQRSMMHASCSRAKADNERQLRRYYVRLPEAFSGSLPLSAVEAEAGNARCITEPVSPAWMHTKAKELREKGVDLFFAGIES